MNPKIRDEDTATPFEDDISVGTRIAFNDMQSTKFLLGLIIDRESDSNVWFFEGSRRIGERWSLDLEVRAFIWYRRERSSVRIP